MPKMSDTELQAILQAEKSDALGAIEASELSSQRAKAMEYYLGDQDLDGDMPAPPDRSKAVSSDVADTIEGLMPALMEIFASGDDVVEFEPVGPEDEEGAQQETDAVTHAFWHRNPGFLTIYSFFKDALLQKNGIVKVFWDETEEEDRETYMDLDDDAYAVLVSDKSVEIVEHVERQETIEPETPDDAAMAGPMMGGMQPPMPEPQVITLHEVTVAKRRTYGRARVEPVPPEEFGISRRARSIHIGEADYCYHEVRRRQSDLIADGYDAAQVETLPTAGPDDTEEEIVRDTVDDSDDIAQASMNKATRLIRVTEHYVRLDYEGNGKAALYKVVTASGSNQILRKKGGKADVERVDFMPFAALTPVIMTHRFFGRSVADLVMDIQRIKTALLRALLDNAYLANNQRMEIAESHAGDRTLDDLLTNRPGGIVRTKQPGGLLPIPNQDIGSFAYPMLEYQDAQREWRTGVTRQGQGIDAKSLADQSATAAAQLFTMAQARMRLIARIFAETGVKDLFKLIHATMRKHGRNQQDTIRLRNKWVTVDPRNWKTRNDMTVNVGIASGSKDQQMAFLMTLLGVQKEALMAPQFGLVQPGKIYATLKRIVELANLKSVETYFTDPDAQDEQGNFVNRAPPQSDPKQIEAEQKLEFERQKATTQFQIEQQKTQAQMQANEQRAAREFQLDQMKIGMERESARYRIDQEILLKREQMQAELALKERQLAAEIALKERLAAMEAAMRPMDPGNASSGVHVGGDPG